MSLSIIVAIATNNGIGKDNQLLWHISEDLKYFKRITLGKPVIMGRKTYESIGKPLPGRRNIIISRTAQQIDGCEVFKSIDDAMLAISDEEAFIIGGAEIYKQTLSKATKLYVTQVFSAFEADVFFPAIDKNEWEMTEVGAQQKDEKSGLTYAFNIYQKK